MNTIQLKEMNETEYMCYFNNKIERYGEVLAQNIYEAGEEPATKAEKQLAALLPQGRKTENHHLYKVEKNSEIIGYVWLKTDRAKKSAFLYEIYILEKFQSRGYGTKTMILIEEWLKEREFLYFKLHVFGSNKGAHQLYERLGFGVAGYNMFKSLN